jgi:hypothetical protein
MSFAFVEEPRLPPLAWTARLVQKDPVVVVRHGSAVETRRSLFFEGAWDGEFSAGRFADALTFSGSGATLTDVGVLFSSSTHTLDRLHFIRVADSLIVSNSLAFLFQEAEDSADPAYWYYDADLISIVEGLNRHRATIPTARGNTIHLYYHCNVHVGSQLDTAKLSKRTPQPFRSYGDYVSFLRSSLAAVQRNATSRQRKVRYTPLATISSGYDSPACAALAREVGCSEAVTFTTCRAEFWATDDTGKAVACRLGLRVKEFDRLAYLRRHDFPEAEFLAWGTGGEDVVMVALEDVLPARLLYTGFHGDKVWARENAHVGHDIERGDPSGSSLAEFRLRVGFIHLPVPFMGCIQHASIHEISNSSEMLQWSIGGDYDRPIPRRLVEDAGVPRHLFGQHKKATTQPLLRRSDKLDMLMTPESHREFLCLLSSTPRWRLAWNTVRFELLFHLFWINYKARTEVAALSRRWGAEWRLPLMIASNFSEGPVWKGLTFHWAIQRLQARYALRLGGAGPVGASSLERDRPHGQRR